MKRASVITIIIAAVIIVAGVICCAVGASSAKKEGFMLFPQKENGESVYTYDFTGRDINRITVDANDANVTLTKGGDRSYIEVRNYNANYYRLNEENRAITFAEIEDVLSMFKFWEGFSFKGMRYVFASGFSGDGDHSIHVNIAAGDDVSSVVLRIKEGSLDAGGVTGEGDITLGVGEGSLKASSVDVGGSFVASVSNGELKIEKISALNVNLSADSAETSVKTVKCEKFTWTGAKRTFFADKITARDISVNASEASVTVSGSTFTNAGFETESGPVRVDLSQPLSSYITDISTQTGNVFINGEKLEGLQYKSIPEKAEEDGDGADETSEEDGETNEDETDTGETEEGGETEKESAPSIRIHTASGPIDLNTAPEVQTEEQTNEG